MDESYIKTGPGGTVFAGLDSVRLFQAMALKSGLRLYAKTGMRPNRAWTPSAMLKTAGSITGKDYKRGQYEQAAADLETWANVMQSAIPVVEG
jgi:hypothetical protein